MATFTREIKHGESFFVFTFDDALQRLISIHAEVLGSFLLEITVGDTVEREFAIPLGTFDRTLNGNQRKVYTLTQSITPTGIRMEADGITPKLTVSLPYRIRGVA